MVTDTMTRTMTQIDPACIRAIGALNPTTHLRSAALPTLINRGTDILLSGFASDHHSIISTHRNSRNRLAFFHLKSGIFSVSRTRMTPGRISNPRERRSGIVLLTIAQMVKRWQ